MLNPLRLVLKTFGSALGGSPRRSLLSMLNIFEPFRSSPSLGGSNEKRTTRLHIYEPVIRARGQLERLSTIDREQLETNLLGPGMWGPQTSWRRTFLHRPSDLSRWSMEIWLLDKVKYPDASGYAEWRQSSGTTQRDRNSKHMIYLFRCWQLGHVRITHTSKVKLIV
ncbi:hypothetical protein D6D13_00608 [Aureobasidium pullulans]|uniref:Uncharacterized protein n=1 Tax=Aureobasidium pullulans TaxID=5580 RepID=A0A4S9DA32_AURPU|nr:hypothetical protein D6D13_00608 [Aureobasidium pullulans]